MSEIDEIQDLDPADELIAERRSEMPGDTPEDMVSWMRTIVGCIDRVNYRVGQLTCLLVVPIILIMVYEVVARKLFASPTDFSYEYSRMLAGVMFMMGAGYALMRGVHIRADFIYRNWREQRQATVDATLYLAFYFPAMLFFFWISLGYWWDAWQSWERSMDTAMMAPLAPARTAMPLGTFFLLIQGIAELLRCLHKMEPGRRQIFLKALPIYLVSLFAIFIGTFWPDVFPLFSWFSNIFGAFNEANMPTEWIGTGMIGVMLFSIFVGFPISFTLIFLGFVFGAIGFGGGLVFYLQTLQFNSVMLDDQLVAVPLFIFMGLMMEQAGLMERLFRSIQLMLSRTRGSLYVAVLFVSTIFAAATGIVGASVTILGIMAAQSMNRSNYDVRLAAGTITAGGTLGILIPPSIMLVVMGPVLEIPVTDLFTAAILPGVLLASLYLIYALGRCFLNPALGPILPSEEQPETSPYYWLEMLLVIGSLGILLWLTGQALTGGFAGSTLLAITIPLGWLAIMAFVFRWTREHRPGGFYFSDLWYEFVSGLVPPTALVAFALGSIILGWATPAEAAACGAFGSVFLTLVYRRLNWSKLYTALIKTLEINVLIMFLVAASNFFGAVFSRLGTPMMLTDWLLAMNFSPTVALIFIMMAIFLLGWPLEWVPIVLIIVPILIPALEAMGIDLLWFGILVAINLQTAWLSPPVALSAYFLKGVVPEWELKDIYLGMMQFMVIQLIGLILVFTFPQIALWLVNR